MPNHTNLHSTLLVYRHARLSSLTIFLIHFVLRHVVSPRLHVLHLTEVTNGDTVAEELIDLLEGPVLALRHAQVSEDAGHDGCRAEDEADLRLKTGILLVEQIWDREARGESVHKGQGTVYR